MKNGPEEILGVVFCVIYSVRNKGVGPPRPMPNPAVKRSIAGGTTVCRIPLYLSPNRSRAAAERLFSAAAGVCVWKDVLGLGKLFKNYPRKTRGQLFGVV